MPISFDCGRTIDEVARPRFLFPRQPSVIRVVAAGLGWLGVVVIVLSIVAIVAVIRIYKGETDHGGGAFAVGGVVLGGLFLAAGAFLARLEASRSPWMRWSAAAVAMGGALFFATYPLSWFRDPYSFPGVGAAVAAAVAVALTACAVSLTRRER